MAAGYGDRQEQGVPVRGPGSGQGGRASWVRVAVIGAGYEGLTTAACLSHLGHRVVGADVDVGKVEALNQGLVPIVEDGLEEVVAEGLASGRLRFAPGARAAAEGAEFVCLCVPTPQREDGSVDLSSVEAVAADIRPVLAPGSIVVDKSTLPVGSTRVVERALGRSDVFVVSNPEFLREGSGVHDFLHPDRVVIGAESREAAIRLTELFAGIRAPMVVTDPRTAETIKYASNAFLATKVSYINAVANLCEALGADVREVVAGMGYDKRIGSEHLHPGPGWGGSCLSKDSRALVRMAEDAGYSFDLLKGVIAANHQQHARVAGKIVDAAGGSVDGRRVAVWGLTFKAGTDDLRESPSLEVVRQLVKEGAEVRAHDPTVSRPLPDLEVVTDPYDACDGAHALALLTEWDHFRRLDLGRVRDRMARPSIVDARNLLEPAAARRAGFRYQGIGVP